MISSQTGDVPLPRDDHSLNVHGNFFVIFGGFVSGTRVNEVYYLGLADLKSTQW